MSIKTKIYILFSIFTTALIMLSVVLYSTSQQITIATQVNSDVNAIRKDMSELRLLTFDYILSQPERAKQQWEIKYESLGKLLAPEEHSKHKHSKEGIVTLEKINENHQDLGNIFSQLTQSGISEELKIQLTSQLLIKSQDMITKISQLSDSANKDINDNQTRADYFNAVFLILLLAIALIVIYVIYVSILIPIEKLRKGVEIIRQGNLDYKVGLQTKDELGQLSRSFDEMTENLKKFLEKVNNFANKAKDVINQTVPILQKVAMGDFSENLEIPKKEDEFTELLVTLNLTIDDLRELKKLSDNQLSKILTEKNKISAIVQSIGDAVFVMDKNLKIILFNPVAEKISGYTISEAMGKNYEEVLKFVHEKDDKSNDTFVRDTIRRGKIKEMGNHTVLITKTGKKIPVADSASPLKDKDGKTTGCVVVFRDITREREIEQAKDDFLNIAAHDLRTPMSGIRANTEMILEGDFGEIPPKFKAPLQDIDRANLSLIKMVDDFLTIGRIEKGKITIKPYPIDLLPILDFLANYTKPLAEKRNLKFVCEIPTKLPQVMADSDKIPEVINNLLDNAIKYTDKGSISLKVSVTENSVIVAVADTGAGIPKDRQKDLFQKYSQVDGGKRIVSGKGTGLGLGLYISCLIIEGCNGKIWVESEPNKGSTFYFSLPLVNTLKTTNTNTKYH